MFWLVWLLFELELLTSIDRLMHQPQVLMRKKVKLTTCKQWIQVNEMNRVSKRIVTFHVPVQSYPSRRYPTDIPRHPHLQTFPLKKLPHPRYPFRLLPRAPNSARAASLLPTKIIRGRHSRFPLSPYKHYPGSHYLWKKVQDHMFPTPIPRIINNPVNSYVSPHSSPLIHILFPISGSFRPVSLVVVVPYFRWDLLLVCDALTFQGVLNFVITTLCPFSLGFFWE